MYLDGFILDLDIYNYLIRHNQNLLDINSKSPIPKDLRELDER